MIPKQLTREQLLGRLCRPVREIKNGAGNVVTPDTICKIADVVRGHGFTIKTEKCPYCGQAAYISRISRDSLQLAEQDARKPMLQCGQTCWVVERDEDGEAYELGGYVFIAQIPGYAIVVPTLNGSDNVQVLMDDQVRQTAEDYHGDLAVFPAKDVYVERQKAQEALDNAIKEE